MCVCVRLSWGVQMCNAHLVVEDLLQNMQHMLEWQSFHSMSNNLVAVEVGVGVGVGDWVRVLVCSTSP